jgi:branched-subunit amino acid transport protein
MNIEKIKTHIKNNWFIYCLLAAILIVILAVQNKELVFSVVAGIVVTHYFKALFPRKSVDPTKK